MLLVENLSDVVLHEFQVNGLVQVSGSNSHGLGSRLDEIIQLGGLPSSNSAELLEMGLVLVRCGGHVGSHGSVPDGLLGQHAGGEPSGRDLHNVDGGGLDSLRHGVW